jgi:hypothetical protein
MFTKWWWGSQSVSQCMVVGQSVSQSVSVWLWGYVPLREDGHSNLVKHGSFPVWTVLEGVERRCLHVKSL